MIYAQKKRIPIELSELLINLNWATCMKTSLWIIWVEGSKIVALGRKGSRPLFFFFLSQKRIRCFASSPHYLSISALIYWSRKPKQTVEYYLSHCRFTHSATQQARLACWWKDQACRWIDRISRGVCVWELGRLWKGALCRGFFCVVVWICQLKKSFTSTLKTHNFYVTVFVYLAFTDSSAMYISNTSITRMFDSNKATKNSFSPCVPDEPFRPVKSMVWKINTGLEDDGQ